MNLHKKLPMVFGSVLLFLLATPSSWAEPETGAEAETKAETDAEAEAEATGLDIVLDGSSLEAFNEGLDEIKETSTEREYEKLEKSINYLLFYDLVAKQDKARLAERLDGMTGRQVIQKVERRRKLQ